MGVNMNSFFNFAKSALSKSFDHLVGSNLDTLYLFWALCLIRQIILRFSGLDSVVYRLSRLSWGRSGNLLLPFVLFVDHKLIILCWIFVTCLLYVSLYGF